MIEEAKALAEHGIVFGEPKTDIDKVRVWKEKVINQLTGGLAGMAKGRKVKVVNGLGKFTGANTLEVEAENATCAPLLMSVSVVALAIARIAGETAPLLFTALSNQFWSTDMMQPIANLPVPITAPAASFTVTVLPASPLPVSARPSALTTRSVGASGAVVSPATAPKPLSNCKKPL